MRATDGPQATITCRPVNVIEQTFSLQLSLEMSLPIPHQDEHLPDQIEAYVHQVGLEVQRRLFRLLIEKADRELVLQQRHGKAGAGIQRRGTRPFTFKTTFGEVTVGRSRILHQHDGTIEVLSATVWGTSHPLMITRNLRDAVGDQMSDQSTGQSRADVCQDADDEDLLGRTTILDIVPQEGEQLVAAQRERAQAIISDASPAQLALLGPAVVNSRNGVGIECCRNGRCQNQFARPLDRQTSAPTGERQENLTRPDQNEFFRTLRVKYKRDGTAQRSSRLK